MRSQQWSAVMAVAIAVGMGSSGFALAEDRANGSDAPPAGNHDPGPEMHRIRAQHRQERRHERVQRQLHGGDRHRLDRRAERADHRRDRRAERGERRRERRASRAEHRRERRDPRFDRRGKRIHHRLDEKSEQAAAPGDADLSERLDERGERPLEHAGQAPPRAHP
jgi:hypothetical protein